MKLYFYDISDTQESMRDFSQRMKRQILSDYLNCEISEPNLHTNEYGKPSLVDDPAYFNISHTEKLWVMIVNNTSPVGIDIERHKLRKNMSAMVMEYFHADEYGAYMKQETQEFFYTLWTQKEAYAKYIGHGMAYDFSKESFVHSPPDNSNIITKTFKHPSVEHALSLSIAVDRGVELKLSALDFDCSNDTTIII